MYNGQTLYTVFVPTNEAFDKLPSGTLNSLTKDQIIKILQYHTITGKIVSSQLQASQDVKSVEGDDLYITKQGGTVTVNGGSTVTNPDMLAKNGVIHVVDNVILPPGIRPDNIVDKAASDNNFSTLVQAVKDAGLADVLSYTGPYTVFAPTNDAFNKLPSGTLASLSTDQLQQILKYHVVAGKVTASDLTDGETLTTLEGEKLYVSIKNGTVSINGATVTTADLDVSNGVIHVIDNVLLPDAFQNIVQNLQKRPDFSTLVDAVSNAGLASALSGNGPFTVFAPTNEAFGKLPTGTLSSLTTDQLTDILKYHVINADIKAMDLSSEQEATTLNGQKVFITKDAQGNVTVNGNAMVTQADLVSSNGVIHAVDHVLFPDSFNDVTGIIAKRYQLSKLDSLLNEAGLISALQAQGPFTIFAPDNMAFDNLPAGTLDNLTTAQLQDILKYHVVSGKILSSDLQPSQTVTTLNGQTITITVSNGVVKVNGNATVKTADLTGTNGVIHIIDGVLTP
jgi:transforming growth factor-beta-induced protein